MNNTISPPKKIKNKIKENQFSLLVNQINTHISMVWVKIIAIRAMGWEQFIKLKHKIVETIKTILILSGFSLLK